METGKQYAKAFNMASECLINNSSTSKRFLHKVQYGRIKEECPTLPTGLVQCAVKSNLESGLGRPDIVLLDDKNSRAAIFEIKQARKEDEIESKKSEALSQIKEKDYRKSFEEYDTILQYSIIFHRKKAFVTKIDNNY